MKDLSLFSDFELINEVKKGNFGAFEDLVYRHDKKVLSIAAHYVNNAEDAKDIYQEVFLRVYKGIDKFKMKSGFATWLFRITTNVCLTFCKRNQNRRDSTSYFPDEYGDNSGVINRSHAAGNAVSEQPVKKEISDRISVALNLLSPQQKIIFMLKHYEGYKLKEIAVFLKCTEGTVKKQLFTAVRRLRGELKDLYMEGAHK
jgi:RNA polymerase sigma-70 factor (ECF subfamily)